MVVDEKGTTGGVPDCPKCGAARRSDVCPNCGADDRQLDATRRALEQSREKLSAWRERLSQRIEESERKRELLASPQARRAAEAPTVRLPEVEPLAAPIQPSPIEALPATTAPPPARDPIAAARAEVAAHPLPPASTGDLPTTDTDTEPLARPREIRVDPRAPTPGHLISVEPEEATPRPRILEGDLFAEDHPPTWTPGDVGPTVFTVDDDDETAPVKSSTPRTRPTNASTSVMRRTAAFMLDIVLMLLGPAALLSLPLGWLSIDNSVGILWSERTASLALFFAVLFILLETAYLGAVGRTPGMRLVGTRVVNDRGAIPTFGQALIRSVLFPAAVIPFIERIAETRTIDG